jgi:hypothetical protein
MYTIDSIWVNSLIKTYGRVYFHAEHWIVLWATDTSNTSSQSHTFTVTSQSLDGNESEISIQENKISFN